MQNKPLHPFKEVSRQLELAIPDGYGGAEKRQMIRWLLESTFGVSPASILAQSELQINPEKLAEVVKRLQGHEPVQYIIGEVLFYDCRLKVAEGVLIPRPETEELAYRIVQENTAEEINHLWDVCSGSGCLAISLAKKLGATASGIDFHPVALQLGKENAVLNNAPVTFHAVDLLKEPFPALPQPQIMVSNPPYVTLAEKKQMRENVLLHEPHEALFVSDKNPLIFYEIILKKAWERLPTGGKVYLEINEQFGKETQALAASFGFGQAETWQDWGGKDRFIKAVK